jgi:hypothetical protein
MGWMMSRAGTALMIALAACTDAGPRDLAGPGEAKPLMNYVASVSVCCAATVYQGVSYQVYANVYDENGQRMYYQTVGWSTSGNGVAAIYGSTDVATVQAVGVGTTTIYANVGGVVASTTLTVIAAPVLTTIQIQNAPINVQMPYSRTVTAKGYDQYGNQMSGITFGWSVGSTSIATVSSSGTVTPVAPGTTTLTASANGVSTSAQLTVTPALSGSLSGPNTIWTAGYYQWSVTPSGGNGSYTYQWYVDYAYGSQTQALSTSDATQLYVDENTGPFIIRVVVSSGGSTTEPGTMVCNFIAGANC